MHHPLLFREAKLLTIIQRYLLNKAQICGWNQFNEWPPKTFVKWSILRFWLCKPLIITAIKHTSFCFWTEFQRYENTINVTFLSLAYLLITKPFQIELGELNKCKYVLRNEIPSESWLMCSTRDQPKV